MKRVAVFVGPPTCARAEISIIPCRANFVKRKVAQILRNIFSRFCVFCLLQSGGRCGIVLVSRGGNASGVGKPTLGVELLAEAVYDPTFRHATFLKEILRNPLTNPLKCDTIRVQKARARQSQRERPTRVRKTYAR